jgi:hypothetical protein
MPTPREEAIEALAAGMAKATAEAIDRKLDARLGPARLSQNDLEALAEYIDATIASAVEKALAAVPVPKYRGGWQAGLEYPAGSLVSRGGVWHAERITTSRPGDDDSWTLCLRRADSKNL